MIFPNPLTIKKLPPRYNALLVTTLCVVTGMLDALRPRTDLSLGTDGGPDRSHAERGNEAVDKEGTASLRILSRYDAHTRLAEAMRLIVACGECQRQYDASGREIGSRFRCHCGKVVTVEQPKGHDAAVVRCSSCGAPREEGSQKCTFCGADFTLHERDLDTVCPECLSRISRRAKFCHHCGTALVPEELAGDETGLTCPACSGERRLTNRQIGDVAVLECGQCAGLWLGTEPFKRLTQRAAKEAIDFQHFLAADRPRPAESEQSEPQAGGGWRYRKCPLCEKMMHRRNYGHHSGVIIDACKDHGIWFDADELPRILAWIRSGREAEAKKRRADKTARDERIERRAAIAREPGRMMMRGGGYGLGARVSPAGGFLAEIISGLLG